MHPEGTGPEDENVMSARSTAQLALHLLEDFPEVLETTSIPKKEFPWYCQVRWKIGIGCFPA